MKPIEHYDKYGYTILRGIFSNKEVSTIDKHVDRVYKKWLQENKTEVYDKKLVNMHSLTRSEYFEDCPEERIAFFEIIAAKKLTKALESMFGPDIHFHNTQLFFNPTNLERLPYWHRDMQYSPIDDAVQSDVQGKILSLHVRIPLVEEKGVELVAGTQKRWDTELERNVRFELNGHKNSDPLPNSELISLVPRDILIFDAQMIHRGNYELNPTRKAFDLCVGKYHPLSLSFLDESVLPTEDELDYIDNNQWYKLAREIITNKSNRKGVLKRISS